MKMVILNCKCKSQVRLYFNIPLLKPFLSVTRTLSMVYRHEKLRDSPILAFRSWGCPQRYTTVQGGKSVALFVITWQVPSVSRVRYRNRNSARRSRHGWWFDISAMIPFISQLLYRYIWKYKPSLLPSSFARVHHLVCCFCNVSRDKSERNLGPGLSVFPLQWDNGQQWAPISYEWERLHRRFLSFRCRKWPPAMAILQWSQGFHQLRATSVSLFFHILWVQDSIGVTLTSNACTREGRGNWRGSHSGAFPVHCPSGLQVRELGPRIL